MSQDIFADDSDGSFGWIPLSGKVRDLKEVVHHLSPSEESNLSTDNGGREIKRFKGDQDVKRKIVTSPRGEVNPNMNENETLNLSPGVNVNGTGSNKLGKLLVKKELASSDDLVALEDISNDDEVWLVQCPTEVTEEALKGQCFYIGNNQDCNLLSSDGNCTLKMKVSAATKKTSFSCLIPSREQGCLKSVVLPSAGHIVVFESVSEDQSAEEISLSAPMVSSKSVHSLPTNLKLRHPLLGLNFRKCQGIQ